MILGVGIPFLMFESWLAVILGSGSVGGGSTAAAAGAEGAVAVDPLALLRDAGDALVTPLIDGFTFLAVATSAIGFILGLSDFFADTLQVRRANGVGARCMLVAHTLLTAPQPPVRSCRRAAASRCRTC